MPGRAEKKHTRVYVDGYDFGPYLDGVGPLDTSFTEAGFAALTDPVKGYLPGLATISPGILNGALDNTPAGLHAVMSAVATGPGYKHTLLVAIGTGGQAPVANDPTFSGIFGLDAYKASTPYDATVLATLPFSPYDATSEPGGYPAALGRLLHPKAAETAANAGNTPNADNLVASANGGILVYQLLTSNGTVTLSVDDSANGTAWAGLAGATSGSINAAVTPVAGQVALALGAAVREFLRWQLVLGTATTATFISAFIRG